MFRFRFLYLLLATLTISATTIAQTLPRYLGLHQIELGVADVETSARFYQRLFGMQAWHTAQQDQVTLALGASYLILAQSAEAGVQRSSLATDKLDVRSIQQYLLAQGLRVQEGSSANPEVIDGDGIHTTFTDPMAWEEQLRTAATPVQNTAGSAAIFQPLLLDELHLMVKNMEVDPLFYSRLLGQTGTLQAGSLWYTIGTARLRLSQTPVGQTPGISYVGVLVSNTDLEAAAEAVFAAGGIIETILPNGFSFWDPDGLRIVVRATGMY